MMGIMRSRLLSAALFLAIASRVATPAAAAWMRAETAHFVVYSDDSEDAVRRAAVNLETFDGVLRRFHATAEQDGAGSNKLTVFVVDNVDAVQRLCGRCPDVYGFYSGRASGSVAFTPRRSGMNERTGLGAQTVLYHEYAHHFLFENYAMAYPAWFSEGYAEFASTFQRGAKGLIVGTPPLHRAYGLLSGARLPAELMFDPGTRKLSAEQLELIYGRGWLLTHYIMFDPERMKQFTRYLSLLNTGTPSVKAATEAFGKLSDLDRALDGYLRARTIKALTIKPEAIPEPKVAIRPLSPGEAALIDQRLVSKRGVDPKTAQTVFAKARPIAARFPEDPVVQGWFAEMAYDAEQLDAADQAADRAIAKDPKSPQGLLYKGMIGILRATRNKATDPAVWRDARAYVIRANQVDNNAAQPLLTFYESFGAQGRTPPKNAVAALMRAQELAPQDRWLRLTAVSQQINDGDIDRARRLLRPLAYSAHAGADGAARLLTLLDAARDKAAAKAALDTVTREQTESDNGVGGKDKPET